MKKTSLLITLIFGLLLLVGGTFAVLLHHQQTAQSDPASSSGAADPSGSSQDAKINGAPISDIATTLARICRDGVEDAKAKNQPDPASHIIAHRGTSGESLEHSFESYDKAISQGITNIEQDIVISADGTLYVSHDLNAARMTGDGRAFSAMSDSEIDSITTKAGYKTLKLSEVFDRYGRDIRYIIELKSSDQATIDSFTALVNSYGMADNIVAQCFHLDALQKLEEIYPDMPKLYLCETGGEFEQGYNQPYVDIVSVKYNMMSEDIAARTHDAGKQLSAWTIDTEDSIKKAISIGVDIYFTDSIERALALEKEYRKEPSDTSADSGSDSSTEPSVIFFASDYQKVNGWPEPSETIDSTLQSALSSGLTPNRAVFCGDYTNDRNLHDYQLSPEDSISTIKKTVKNKIPSISDDDMLFVQGNHDKLTDSISSSGLHEFSDCFVYVLNTENDFPWKQGKTSGCLSKVERASRDMNTAFDTLIKKDEKKPVLIAGHVPLHFTARTSSKHTTGDNLYSSLIFNTVNEAAEKLDIVYFFGHNHSKGWDCYMGGSSVYKSIGDKVLIPSFNKTDVTTDKFTEETLRFTYLNAGYIGYYMNCGPEEADKGIADRYKAADGTLTSTVCQILPEEIVLTRFSPEGTHPLGWDGSADPYKNYIDRGLIDEGSYAKKTESPQKIKRRH